MQVGRCWFREPKTRVRMTWSFWPRIKHSILTIAMLLISMSLIAKAAVEGKPVIRAWIINRRLVSQTVLGQMMGAKLSRQCLRSRNASCKKSSPIRQYHIFWTSLCTATNFKSFSLTRSSRFLLLKMLWHITKKLKSQRKKSELSPMKTY